LTTDSGYLGLSNSTAMASQMVTLSEHAAGPAGLAAIRPNEKAQFSQMS
jgi:hypothetical protein